MSWSFGEIRSLCVLSCRGAGMDWGVSEEAAFSVLWLERRGLGGVDLLSRHLIADVSDNCPVRTGIMVSDGASLTESTLRTPLLIVPFLVHAYNTVDLHLDSLELTFGSSGIIGSVTDLPHLDSAFCRWCASPSSPSPQRSGDLLDRIDCPLSSVSILEDFASRTYAPATSYSRETGAGASTDDND